MVRKKMSSLSFAGGMLSPSLGHENGGGLVAVRQARAAHQFAENDSPHDLAPQRTFFLGTACRIESQPGDREASVHLLRQRVLFRVLGRGGSARNRSRRGSS